MRRRELRAEDFSKYPPKARALAVGHLAVLRQIPLALLPVILKEVIDYDWRFPAEQRAVTRQLDYLATLQAASLARLMSGFSAIRLPAEVSKIDWVNQPQRFSEQLSTLLWSTQQVEDYRTAAQRYQEQMELALAGEAPAIPRFSIVIVGQGVSQTNLALFRPLRPHGVLFQAVQPDDGLEILIDFVKDRARRHPEPYAHWYIDGGRPEPACGSEEGVTQVSYHELAPVALKELDLTSRFVALPQKSGIVETEAIQSFMAALRPADLGIRGKGKDATLLNFEVKILTQGAGTQIFSTTFVQWTAREALRRAQPVTMLARFAPRQRMAPMGELLKRNPLTQGTDPEGSLVDADMGAYYTWIDQNRLADADQAHFLVWYEGHNLALAIAPGMPAGTTSNATANLEKILQWMS